ncbi:hypothetical protein ILP97_46330 [Amycolatopsis sp. H6(2020)]|nr:hypothetical protein [Amycolatopsis sp. H6(2020)]
MHAHSRANEADRPRTVTGLDPAQAHCLLALQRRAGNQAVTAVLRDRAPSIVVQRDLDDADSLFPTHYNEDLALFNGTPVVMSDYLRKLESTEEEPEDGKKWNEDDVYGELVAGQNRYTEQQKTAQETVDGVTAKAKSVVESTPPTEDLAKAKTLLATHDTLQKDQWTPDYVSEFLYRQLLLSVSDIPEHFPQKLIEGQSKDIATGDLVRYRLTDTEGREFGGLRGTGGASALFYRWLGKHGGDPRLLSTWFEGQRGSSWSTASTQAKFFYTAFRNVELGNYFWHTDLPAALDKVGNPVWLTGQQRPSRLVLFSVPYINSLISQHVFTYELLRRTAVPNTDLTSKEVTLIRLENQDILKAQNKEAEPKLDEHITLTRGPAESFSLVEPYKNPKTEGHTLGPFYVTIQSVPLHRVFATYFQSKPDEPDATVLLGDGENEFIVMSEGVEAVFRGTDG